MDLVCELFHRKIDSARNFPDALRVFNGAFRIWHFVMSGSSGYGEGCGIIAPFIYIAMHVVKPPRLASY